ncbi:UNVERIFIED_CONTAM: hypothetical protein Slati_0829500 [Sesamum latifolium]|uniref:DUF4283 domain-containing protein n=1 Tax=Sesamum latifolium TaxID=2727402 RepID=A0AAW2XLC3_9LAMI
MRVFKWTLNFDPQIESSIVPIWIRLPELPVHLFEKNALFTLVAKIGKPLRIDEPTADLSRSDLVRVCVELDLTATKVQAIYLKIEGKLTDNKFFMKTYRQQVLYENFPPYCSSCSHLGYDIANCIAKHINEKSQTEVEPRPPDNSSTQKEETRDLREIINNKRKGKSVVIDNAPVTTSVENNVENGVNAGLSLNDNDTEVNANAGISLISHVFEPKLLVTPENNQPGYAEVATPDGFIYEDTFIAELLDRDWDAEKTS